MNLTLSNFKGDLFGGINAAIVGLPVALAFGAAAGMDPINGLYGAIAIGILAALFGGTETLISNPTGPMAVVTALVVKGEIDHFGSLSDALPTIFLIFFMAGALQLVFGILRFGKYVHYIPYPVISGFMSGIGIIIIIVQLKSFFGIEGSYNVISTLRNLDQFIIKADWINVLLAVSTILIIYLFPKITKAVPSALIALIVVSTATYFLGFNVRLIGDIPSELPVPSVDFFTQIELSRLTSMFFSAFSLAALGTIDCLLTAVVADKITKTKHKSDRELLGQGIGNMFASLIGGIPGSGTTPSTVLNIKSGARTRLSGIMHGIFLLLIIMVGGPVASQIPYAVLAGILITVGVSILDTTAIKHFKKVPKEDNIIMIVVLVLTVFWSLLYAVAIGLVMAALIFMKKMADVVEGESKDTRVDRIVNQLISTFDDEEEFRKQVIVRNLRGPMFFGFASRFQDNMDELPNVKAIILNLSGVPYIDQSGMYTLEEAIARLKDKGMNVCLSEVNQETLDMLKGIGLIPNLVDDEHLFSSVEEGIMWLHEPGHLDDSKAKEGELYIPSAYTPNGDGINDEWQIRNIDKYPEAIIKIYDREGNQVYENVGYMEPWEGVYKGKNLPADKYHYSIDLHGDGSEIKEGVVSIFR